MTAAQRPELLDSTLREGEQTPGVIFSVEDKLAIACALDAFGVDYLEAGHPAVSRDVARATKAVCNAGLDAETFVHARADIRDIDAAIDCGADWVGIFYSVRNEALEQRFRRDLDQVVAQVVAAVQHAKDHGLRVRYTPEDTVRSPWSNVRIAAQAAVEAGADRISIADTTGCMTPTRMADVVHRMRSIVDVPIHAHCHNDLGLAAANSLAAIEAGAQVVDVAVNGLGERTGISDLAQVATALRVAYGLGAWDLGQLPDLSQLVSERSGFAVPQQAPIVGRNAFRHNAGLHVAAVFHDPSHYESIPAELVGRTRHVVVDRFAGLATLRYKCRELGIEADEGHLQAILEAIKNGEMNEVEDDAFRALAEGVLVTAPPARAP